MNADLIRYLNNIAPGSVHIDPESGIVTLTDWKLEQQNTADDNHRDSGNVERLERLANSSRGGQP